MSESVNNRWARPEAIANALPPSMVPVTDAMAAGTDNVNVVQTCIWDPEEKRLWEDPEAFTEHAIARAHEQCRQYQSSLKYSRKEDLQERVFCGTMAIDEAAAMLADLETQAVESDRACRLSVDDEGLFHAREDSVEFYFPNMTEWTPLQEGDRVLRQKFQVDQQKIGQLKEVDRKTLNDIIRTVMRIQQRRVALERNRRKLHVLIEDGIKSLDLYNQYINAVKCYDYFICLLNNQRRSTDASLMSEAGLMLAGMPEQNGGKLLDEVSFYVADGQETERRSKPLHITEGADEYPHCRTHSLSTLHSYREYIIKTCVVGLKVKRHEVYNLTTILDHSRIWSEDLLERAVATEKQIQTTVNELLCDANPIPTIAPPDISGWLEETEQVAHTCANVSYVFTCRVNLHPNRLHDAADSGRWLLGIPTLAAFAHVPPQPLTSDEEEEED